MGDDVFAHLESLGVSFNESHAAADYSKAATLDQLQYAAGEHLALHATAIMHSMALPKKSALALRLMHWVARRKWERHCRVENDVFCHAALLDLCTVRTVFVEEKRWPELASLIDWSLVMAVSYRALALRMSPEEKEQLHQTATAHLIDFQDRPNLTPEQQRDGLLSLDGVSKDRVEKLTFLRYAIKEPTWIDPWALIRHYDRIAAA